MKLELNQHKGSLNPPLSHLGIHTNLLLKSMGSSGNRIRVSRTQSDYAATTPKNLKFNNAPSGNRNRGTSLEGKYVTTTPKVLMENGGIDPPASRMLSVRSTIWANSPSLAISSHRELNTRPYDYKSYALPTEL